MHCRLGSFANLGTSAPLERLEWRLRQAERGGKPAQGSALLEWVRQRLTSLANEEPALDLREVLGQGHADRPWVDAVAARLEELRAGGGEVSLHACEYEPGPDGHVIVVVNLPDLFHEVAPGDVLQGGFCATRRGERAVRLRPRLVRVVCSNGAVAPVGDRAEHDGVQGFAAALRTFTTAEFCRSLVESLGETRRVPAAPFRYGPAPAPGPALPRRYRREVDHRLEREGDTSLYGFVNAITATARGVRDWSARLELEETAGRIAWLRRPTPERRRGEALTLA